MGSKSPKPTGSDYSPQRPEGHPTSLRGDGTNQLIHGQPPGHTGKYRMAQATNNSTTARPADAAQIKSPYSAIHQEIKTLATAHPGEKVDAFGAGETFRHYVLEGHAIDKIVKSHQTKSAEYIHQYKAYFVHGLRDPIKIAAGRFDLPPVLLAGTVYNEVGGSDYIKPAVFQARKWIPHTGSADETSLGPTSIQVRNAVATLGYNPTTVDPKVKADIVDTLIHDNAFAIFTTAKLLGDLRTRYFPSKGADDLSTEELEVVAARYNRGTRQSPEEILQTLSYGLAIIKRKDQLLKLLTEEPVAKPDWSEPIKKGLHRLGEAYERAAESGAWPVP